MNRAQMCEIAGVEPNTFKVLRHKGVLPFTKLHSEAKGADGRQWSRYTPREAAEMIAALDLSRGQSLAWADACEILRSGRDPAGVRIEGYSDSPFAAGKAGHPLDGTSDQFIGRAETLRIDGTPSPHMSRFAIFHGPLADVALSAASRASGHNERADPINHAAL